LCRQGGRDGSSGATRLRQGSGKSDFEQYSARWTASGGRPLDDSRGDFAHGYDKGAYLEDLTDEVIEVITEHAPRKNSPLSVLLF
jgi:hypothetical protein